MAKVFEDYFMEVQTGLIGLCMELAENKPVDLVFVYGSIENNSSSFNAFFVTEGKVLPASKLVNNRALSTQFLRLGVSDLAKLIEICKQFDRPVPTELRLRFNVKKRSLDTHYEYKPICTLESDITPFDVFCDWMKRIEKEIQELEENKDE